jgi:hypothetical protein
MAALDQLQGWLQPSHAGIASTTEMRRYCSRAGFRRLQITKPRWFLMLAEGTSSRGRLRSTQMNATPTITMSARLES